MEIRKFEDLEVWRESMSLSVALSGELKHCRHFSLRDQIYASSVSIPSNIAEGYERRTNKEFIQHLYIAKGSCGELRTQLYLCLEMELIARDRAEKFIDQTRKISAMLARLIQTRYDQF